MYVYASPVNRCYKKAMKPGVRFDRSKGTKKYGQKKERDNFVGRLILYTPHPSLQVQKVKPFFLCWFVRAALQYILGVVKIVLPHGINGAEQSISRP